MINFVSGSPLAHMQRMAAFGAAQFAGQMACPFSRNRIGLPLWCLDNGCFNRYDPASIVRMLIRYANIPGCVFAAVPDVVSDHAATLTMFHEWSPIYREAGYPMAFVLQDGIGGAEEDVPWADIAAVFIGGSTRFKYSNAVRGIVAEAKRRGKWVHMGRVNTLRRIVYAAAIGCDSTDGTRFQRFKDAYKFSPAFTQRQTMLWGITARAESEAG